MGVSANPAAPASRLSLWDTISIIVGIIVGVGIYKTPGDVFHEISSPWLVLAVWALGGILSLLGALCFAELASTYPRSGGEYVYLSRAFGPVAGFAFAWTQLTVIRTGAGLAAPAYVLAESAAELCDLEPRAVAPIAALVISALTAINILGTLPGKWAQNVLTVAKVAILAGIVVVGLFFVRPRLTVPVPQTPAAGSFGLAMVYVLYTYGGWNEAAYVSCEVRNFRRNLPLALIAGTALVTALYLLVNVAFLVGLGPGASQGADTVAAELLSRALGPTAGNVMRVLVIVSILGVLNGMIFTGSRIFSEMGADHRVFAPLGWWSRRLRTPVWSLVIQAAISIGLVFAVRAIWKEEDGFTKLLECTAPVWWLFLFLTGLSLFVLRVKDRHIERAFRVPLYPLVPLVFCGWSLYMLIASLRYAREEALVGVAILLAGLPVYWLSPRLAPWKPGKATTLATELATPEAARSAKIEAG